MKNSHRYPVESLFKGLRPLLDSLPTEEEKRQLLQTLKESQRFLEELQRLVEAIPTMESSQELSEGLSRLYSLSELAGQDTGLRKLLGMRGPVAANTRKAPVPQEMDCHIVALKERVADSEPSEIKALLVPETLGSLKQLSAHFGLTIRSKESKDNLINRIVTYIENQRGYQVLRDGQLQK